MSDTMNSNTVTESGIAERLARLRARLDYQGIMLGVLCAVVTLMLLLGDRGTRDLIGQRQMEDRLALLAQVLPPTLYDNNPLQDAVRIVDAEFSAQPVDVYPALRNGELQGAAFQLGTVGYGGVITLMLGVDRNGVIQGVRVLSHKETPGLADKIERDKGDWILSFDGKSLSNTGRPQWAVQKDGGEFDQFTGATITPRAIVNGVHSALEFYARHAADIAAAAHGSASKQGNPS
ncbi:MAG: electron transport complex subunit RsxG [Pseudomonadota bacterium]